MHPALEHEAAPALETIYREPGHRCYGYANVVVVYSVGEPDLAYMQRNSIAMRRYASQYPAGLGAIVVVPDEAKPPSEAALSALRSSYGAMKDFMRGVVLTMEGQGFAAAAKRSAFTVLSLAAPLPFPVKVAGSAGEAAVKLAKLLGPALDARVDPPLLAAAIERARVA